jgi:tetratricopeptide (TPR) repeat protein
MTDIRGDLAHARVLLDLKRYDKAASLLALVVAVEPADSRAWCLLAHAHLGNAQYQEAAAAAKQAITLAPADDWPYRLASIAQRHLGSITAARAAATESCKLAPNQWHAYTCLAQAQLAGRLDFHGAERAAANARRLAPDEAEVHHVSGLVSSARAKWKAARAHQERARAGPGPQRRAADRAHIIHFWVSWRARPPRQRRIPTSRARSKTPIDMGADRLAPGRHGQEGDHPGSRPSTRRGGESRTPQSRSRCVPWARGRAAGRSPS